MATARLICGVDEAGRGPLAGPVFAAAVILDPNKPIPGLMDSKLLSASRREKLEADIKAVALAWSVASATVEEIDRINILRATLLAMRRAVESLPIRPEEALIDGLHCPPLGCPSRPVVRGDRTVAVISAASILAKTARDREMLALHRRLPDYGFDRHKGYPTPAHLAALQEYGASDAHRRSFAPVKQIVAAGESRTPPSGSATEGAPPAGKTATGARRQRA